MKAAYEAMGRLDEGKRVAALNDVDIYLRAREAGYRNIWKPYVELYHYESAIRRPDTSPVKYARFEQEGQYIRDRWSGVLENDPAYSLNLTLDCGDVSYAWPPRVPTYNGICEKGVGCDGSTSNTTNK